MECKIRAWKTDDAVDLANAINNKNVLDNLRDGLPFPYTEKDALDYINIMLDSDQNNNFSFAITVDDKAIGSVGAFRKENIHCHTAEIGYYIAEEYWKQGYGTSAIKQTCNYVFNNTDIIRIFATPFANNIASCRILEKAGFEFEGVLRKNAVKNGKVLDMKMYAIIKND